MRSPLPPERDPPAPEAAARKKRMQAALAALLLVLLVVPLARGWRRARWLSERDRAPPPPPSVDLARDPAWRLTLLPGVGPRRAEAIVRAREEDGPPRTLADLARIPSIGPSTLRRLCSARSVRVLLAGRPVRCADGLPTPPADGSPP